MVSMEHQLKSELEKPVECIEDRVENKMKKFEQIMKNAATTSSCYVTSAPKNDSATHI